MGIDTKFTWTGNKKISAVDLVQNELLPLAKIGLEKRNINSEHIDKYLGIIEERVKRQTSGARWILRTFTKFKKETSVDESLTTVTAAIFHNQTQSKPVHEWEIPDLGQFHTYDPSNLLVEEFMTTDLITVHKDDILEYALSIMDWTNLDYLPVEDDEGKLYGVITAKSIMKYLSKESEEGEQPTVGDLMNDQPITVKPHTTITEVVRIMRENQLKVLPVVKHEELIGVISEENFVDMSRRLIQRMSKKK